MTNEHIDALTSWRMELVEDRRRMVVDGLGFERTTSKIRQLLAIQNHIEALDRAIADERKLLKPSQAPTGTNAMIL